MPAKKITSAFKKTIWRKSLTMIEADVIVLATPVYFYTMCAQMKTLIDRTLPRYTHGNLAIFNTPPR